ncbi:hypothetical protein [Corynebacterium sp. A21]|uniref:hypothetical protein n=1 Tax=Corynebacterium sp. A21 TaxID=3457318 RepID=UPI003FD3FA59
MDRIQLSSNYATGFGLLIGALGLVTAVVDGSGGDLWGSSLGTLEQLLPILEERAQNQQ